MSCQWCEHGDGLCYPCLIDQAQERIRELETENTELRAQATESMWREFRRLRLAEKDLKEHVEALEAENRVVRELVENALDRLWAHDKEGWQHILDRCTWMMGETEADRSDEGRDVLLARIAALTREYQDYQTIADHCTRVYSHFSGGRISKPFTLPEEVIGEAERQQNEDFEEWRQEELGPIKERLLEFAAKWKFHGIEDRLEEGEALAIWIEETFKEKPDA